MITAFPALFRLPPMRLAAPTACPTDPAALQRWLESLPKTHLGQSTRALFQATTELNQVPLPPAQRLRVLELLRPAIHFVCDGLSRHYLGQPLALPEQPLKVAELAHTLLEALTQGYVRIALEVRQQPRQSGFKEPAPVIASALHRALTDTALNLLRDLQLYRDPHPQTWARLHQLASFARSEQLATLALADRQAGDGTLQAAYLRVLLLGSAHTYQLRQDEIVRLYARLADWVAHAPLVAGGGKNGLLVDPASDHGPHPAALVQAAAGPDWLSIDTAPLCAYLTDELKRDNHTPLDQLSNETVALVCQAWQRSLQRHHERQPVDGVLQVSIGLTAAHHFIGGEVDFQLLLSLGGHQRLQPIQENPFLKRSISPAQPPRTRDVWDSPYQAGFKTEAVEAIDYQVRSHHQNAQQSRYHALDLALVNASAGGYCLRWTGDPTQVKTGEIVAIRERGHKSWRVGTVRWVRLGQTGPQLGVELLSPTATAYGARVINKSGPPGDYLRVLVLPAMPELGLPPSLITPRLPFRVGQKIQLTLRDDEARIQLTRRLRATAAFSQFEFNRLGGAAFRERGAPGQPTGSGFDGIWETL